ncbi:hypothetical protein GIB67_010539 [Kingdonia uniflora]|uniref:Arf-GAP domain-containing protein n=1 Tax=Kingdonia uniflora TaxID=39325 RepID=A0A7J7MAP6_9MAGN|nr:hypothetical protein GIB67_010539 [Kingdonia uniflora]
MSSKKEEERNEKVIRGLMKLPPNRRCINCNSLGPQYVCPNFWTFVCTTCSGIHREFTHRVKSVSMAKFTSQEVEALQRGGNQRARELFLKDWDLQRQRLPDSSKVDKIREFIKNVYVNKKYAGESTSDKPPRDMQGLRNLEDDSRRASSYHSYSQSPPYEYQYEDRKYGKQGGIGVLSRKPGSDRGYYDGKISSFPYSPGRLAEQMYEDRFANEGSGSRASDYSASSAGDPFRSNTQSPNFQERISSPPIHPVRDIFIEGARRQSPSYPDANTKRNVDGITRGQRTSSLGSLGSFDSNSMSLKSVNSGSLFDAVSEISLGSFDSNSMSLKSVNSGSLFDAVSEPEQLLGTRLTGMPHVSANPVGPLDPSMLPFAQSSRTSSAPSIFETPMNSAAPSIDLFKQTGPSGSPTIDFFGVTTHQHLSATPVEQKPLGVSFPENEGWATFDLPHHATSVPETKSIPHISNFNVVSSLNTSMQWPPARSISNGPVSSVDNQWHGNLHGVQAFTAPISTEQQWDAFGDSRENVPQASLQNLPLQSEPQVLQHNLPSTADQHLESKVSEEGIPSRDTDWKSTNPFDLRYDSNLEPSKMLFDMSSLQAALPDPQLPPTFTDGLSLPWFLPEDPVTTFINTSTPQGGFAYMAGESQTQFSNTPSQGPIASLGGNPFS